MYFFFVECLALIEKESQIKKNFFFQKNTHIIVIKIRRRRKLAIATATIACATAGVGILVNVIRVVFV